MTRKQIEARINEMQNEYAYSNTWPTVYQEEYEQLCAVLHRMQQENHQPKRNKHRP